MTSEGHPEPKRKTSFEEALSNLGGGTDTGVGYGRPPHHAQFKKGKSGNPKGRPKVLRDFGDQSAHAIVLREANRLVTVREGDEVREITTIEAGVRAGNVAAIKGNAYAQRNMFELFERAKRERRKEIDEDVEWWTTYKRSLWAEIKSLRERGYGGTEFLIHPEDVVINYDTGVTFCGPTSYEEQAQLENTLEFRDLMMMQDSWDGRSGYGEGETGITAAGVFAMMLNTSVPARYRLSDVDFIHRNRKWDLTTKRELRKLLFRASKRLGHHWKPDRIPATIDQFRERFEEIANYVRQWLSENRT